MSPISPARRRAEEFASLLEGRGASAQHTDALQVVAALRAVTVPQPSAAYVSELRSNLLAAADTLLAPAAAAVAATPQVVRPQRHQRKIAVAAGTLALLGGTTGVAMASQSALPGDSLYPLKRILESAQTSLSADDAARADRIMQLATGRLDETRALADSGATGSQAEIPGTLDDFVAQANQAADALLGQFASSGDIDSIIALRGFLADSLDALAGLKGSVPPEYAASFDDAVNALLTIDERALSLCGSCGSLLDIPAILLSGAAIPPAPAPATTAPAPVTAAPQRQTVPSDNAIAELLKKLPLGTAPAPAPTAPAAPTLPLPGDTTPVDGIVEDTPTTSEDPLGSLLGGLLDPLLGDNGLL